MAAPPITVQLTKFEQIEILRAEIEARDEELRKTEVLIRDTTTEIERQRYLQTLHVLFSTLPPPPEAANLPQLEIKRQALREATQVMQVALSALEKETAGQIAPPPRAGGLGRPGAAPAAASGPRRKFDSFDDFKANRPPGG